MSGLGLSLRKKNQLIDDTIKDILTDKSEDSIKTELAIQLGEKEYKKDNEKVNKIYNQARKQSGIDYKIPEPNEINTGVLKDQIRELISSAIKKIEGGEDPEEVINNTEDKLQKMKLSKRTIDKTLNKIFDFFDYDAKGDEEERKDVLVSNGNDIVPLPRVDIDYNELRNLNLGEDEDEDEYPNIDRKLITDKNKLQVEEYRRFDENDDVGREKFTENIYKTQGKLVPETEKLEDFIRQVKLCVLTLPPALSKLKTEDFLIRYLQRVEEKFNNIYVFGWETQRNTDFYKKFDEILKMNNEIEGALFIIRDIKTFNIYAAELFRGIPRNYYIILLNGIIIKEDLVQVENITHDNTFLWPGFADLQVFFKFTVDKSFIYGKHAEAYNKNILMKYDRPLVGMKESYTNTNQNKELWHAARQILNSNFYLDNTGRQLDSFTNPGINLDEAISRSPKFRNMIMAILTNSDSRIFVKVASGRHGIDALLYIYEKLKKHPLKPVVIPRQEQFEIKRGKIQSIPDSGPCLVITDFTLTDVLIPKNIDKVFIAGGGDYHDMETILDIAKGENYTINKYPRSLEVVNFITMMQDNLTKTVDQFDYDDFSDLVTKYNANLQKIKSLSININIKGESLMIRKPDY
jgi:hypothetical protein